MHRLCLAVVFCLGLTACPKNGTPPAGPASSPSPAATAPEAPTEAPTEAQAPAPAAPAEAPAPAPTSKPQAEAPPAAGTCTKDAHCTTFSNYCGGCACQALLQGAPEPTCPTRPVSCLVDPCKFKAARCVEGACVLGEPES